MSDALRSELLALWEAESTTEEPDRLLTLVVRSFAAVDAEAKALLAACNSTPRETHLPNGRFLKQPARDPFYTANLGLFYGRFLVEQRMFDEALEQLNEVPEQRVVDLASLFFFKAVAAQGALQAGPALEAIDRLLNHVERVPVRYLVTATLMQADLQTREEKSLGEIGRLMSDSERRLDLGRAGEKVQGVQERIIFELDEIIKKLEQQQGGGGGMLRRVRTLRQPIRPTTAALREVKLPVRLIQKSFPRTVNGEISRTRMIKRGQKTI